MNKKTTPFRKGQQFEIGFDLKQNHTGNQDKNRKFTTEEGEFMSNFMEQGDFKLGLKK